MQGFEGKALETIAENKAKSSPILISTLGPTCMKSDLEQVDCWFPEVVHLVLLGLRLHILQLQGLHFTWITCDGDVSNEVRMALHDDLV